MVLFVAFLSHHECCPDKKNTISVAKNNSCMMKKCCSVGIIEGLNGGVALMVDC